MRPGRRPLAVHPGILIQGRGQAFLQILERLPSPVAADRIAEGLPVARGTVEIDHHHGVAGARIGLRVPAVVEVVAERPLGPAVDQESDRILLGRIEIDGLDDVAVDGLVVPALEA